MKPLFVYGTLRPGEINEYVLQPLRGTFEKAFVHGVLFPNGWEGGSDCPGLRLDQKAPRIDGLLFRSDRLDQSWTMLDDFEGEHYERVSTTVTLERCATAVEAFIYVIKNQS